MRTILSLLLALCALTTMAYDKLTTTGGTYTLVTPDGEGNIPLQDGDIVIFVSKIVVNTQNYFSVMSGSCSNGYFSPYNTNTAWNDNPLPSQIDLTETTVNTGDNAPFEYILAEDQSNEGNFALLNNAGENDFYVGKGSGASDLSSTTTETYVWTFTNGTNGTNTGTIFTKYISDTKYLRTLPSNYKFNVATSGNTVYIYKKDATSETSEFTFGSTGYATMYYGEQDVQLDYGMTAYTLGLTKDKNNNDILSVIHRFESGEIVPKGNAVMVKGTPNKTYHPTIFTTSASIAEQLSDEIRNSNLLKGTDTNTVPEAGLGKYYKLANDDAKGLGFYWGAANGAAFENVAHKAYLLIPEEKQVTNSLAIDFESFDDVTAIDMVPATSNNAFNATSNSINAFDMQGRSATTNDLFIITSNGKKIIK